MIDALAYEPQFLDHLAPVWRALEDRGRFLVAPDLLERAIALGIEAEGVAAPKPIPALPSPRFDGPVALVASYGDIKKGRRMGYGPFVFLEHGIGQSYAGEPRAERHSSYSGGTDRDDTILNLVPNQHSAARWTRFYPQTRTEIVGCPKLDTLPARDDTPGPVIAISTHFPCSVAPETRPVLGHYLAALFELAERYTIIGHAHPRYHGAQRLFERTRIEFVPDFADVCRRADVYVCDNSSTIYEFAATGRPVVVLNGPGYRRGISHGLRFWEASEVGTNVWDTRKLGAAIDTALADSPEWRASREAALDIVYAHRSGAARRAADAIASAVRVEVAA